MKVSIEFDTEKQDDHFTLACARKGVEMFLLLEDLRGYLRELNKYHEFQSDEASDIVEKIYDRLFELSNERGVRLNSEEP